MASETLRWFARAESSAPQPAAARTLESLRHRIISFELPPDTVLSRNELARQYEISQTPLRDALQILEAEGLVSIKPQSKTVVTRIDASVIGEAMFLRRAVEVEVVRKLAAGIADDDVSRLRMIVSLQETICNGDGEVGAFQDLDEAFHQAMMAAVGYPGIHKIIRANSGHLNRLRRLDSWQKPKLQRIVRQHKAILDTILASDPVAAEHAMRDHLSKTITQIGQLRSEHPNYFRD
ncbi:GntR family transcriptional regulator [Notoacmeibacter sp. MSK16QG-6]|uniref:GntR family transcriptional regulator n=1 Tax=Notoacmeibacter sp. MSK16QG-6 TaxID=2957982 RepID=UPI00209C78A7|nr:GntR family transcriptional regulator [Notoacmeibacter sp. MSK16QG-6]MCP1199562.1 GntR family transcriptional regulator [Notoacmeibacter sp. MSK16QG-6]